VVALESSTLPTPNRSDAIAFQKQTWELQRKALAADAAVDEVLERLKYIKKALLDTPGAGPELSQRALAIEQGLKDAQKQIVGDPTLRRFSEPRAPSILNRISQIIEGHWKTTYGPTKTHRQSYQVAAQDLEEVSERLRQLIDTDLAALEEAMESAGAPWTPGRKISGE
jgi:hypothetical protein